VKTWAVTLAPEITPPAGSVMKMPMRWLGPTTAQATPPQGPLEVTLDTITACNDGAEGDGDAPVPVAWLLSQAPSTAPASRTSAAWRPWPASLTRNPSITAPDTTDRCFDGD
jgi:hypothetical protein